MNSSPALLREVARHCHPLLRECPMQAGPTASLGIAGARSPLGYRVGIRRGDTTAAGVIQNAIQSRASGGIATVTKGGRVYD